MKRVAILVLLLVVAVSCSEGSETRDGLERVSLRLSWLPGATFAGDYLAKAEGLWRKEGLNVELLPGGFEFDSIKLVASGAEDFGVASGPELLVARANGAPVVAIGAVIPDSPIGWVSKQESGITTPEDFVGRRIGAQYGTHTEITLEAMFAALGLDLESIERVPVKFDPRPFVIGEIDVLPVYIIDQPVDLRARGISLNVIDPREYGVALSFGNVYFTSEKALEERLSVVQAFLRGADAGWERAFEDRDAAVDALLESAPELNRDVLRQKIDETFAFVMTGKERYLGVFPMTETEWARTAELLQRHGELGEVLVRDVFRPGLIEMR
ncbi:MAG: ABC transporter substrate-binding protein [Myxococcota bacterium]